MKRRAVGLIAVIGAILILLAAIVLAIVAVTNPPTNVMDLTVGQCFDADFEADEIREVKTVDCSSAHLAEVVLRGELNPDRNQPYPDEAVLLDEAEAACLPAQSKIGRQFAIAPIPANEAAWEATAGRVMCIALAYGLVPTTGSAITTTSAGGSSG